ncbi:uncharacterized protein LOC127795397 isoform X2 [Diospyros lotus]|uniref:uncharacterized protein LOC127795397 isoform X2 n=1 Tax=Diospyros lotus TaxID=55363 RepID=UPI00224D15F7|nr:uncharacterized protein LOC127795397 isoform X2 [Diospyros lotus]
MTHPPFISLSGIGKVPQVYSFWKWGALILALVATFSGVITRIKLLVLRFCKDKFLPSSGPQWTQQLDKEDDEDQSCFLDSSENDEEDDELKREREDSVVSFLLDKFDFLLSEEWGLLSGIHDRIDGPKGEFEMIEVLLKDRNKGERTSSKSESGFSKLNRGLANDIEDVLDNRHVRFSWRRRVQLVPRASSGTY